MNVITADFETYYDQVYSLSKMTTEEYIRDDRFEVIGVSVKLNGDNTEWFSGTKEETGKWLQQFPWKESMLIAHNTLFDAAIFSWHFDIKPKALADTLSMARAIHGVEVGGSLAKLVEHYGLGVKGTEVIKALGKRRLDFTPEELHAYGQYCINDTNLTYALFGELVQGYPKKELRLIDLTLRMFTEPVLELDAFLLEKHLSEVRARKEALLAKLGGDPAEVKKNIMSNPKFAQMLLDRGVEPPMKISPTTGRETFAFSKTDEGLKELLEHEDVEVQTMVAVRLGVKSTIEETRTERFLGIADRGSLPIPLRYYAAHTGRWGGMDKVNMQNLPSRGENANTLKRAILAPPGHVIIDCDSSQIEARMLAWMAKQDDLVDAFAKGEDVYKAMAVSIYGVPIADVTSAQRFIGKTVILGSGYGLGHKKFHMFMKAANVKMSLDEARHIIDTYRFTYPMIPRLWEEGDHFLAAMIDGQTAPYGREGVVKLAFGMVHTPIGIPLKYHQLRRHTKPNGQPEFIYTSRTGVTSIWGGKLTENLIQHLARAVVGEQMLKISKKYRVVLTVHDAIACIAREEEAEEARKYVEECMRWVPEWAPGLPLNCESGMGVNYGEC